VSADSLALADAAPIMRELGRAASKDKRYRRYPVGEEVGRFLRHLRWSDSAENTLDTYEIAPGRRFRRLRGARTLRSARRDRARHRERQAYHRDLIHQLVASRSRPCASRLPCSYSGAWRFARTS
jgi:hypothetical protein